MKKLTLLFLLLVSNIVNAQNCSNQYKYEEQICFSKALHHFTESCADDECQILEILKKAMALKPDRDLKSQKFPNDRGTGSCEFLGGKVIEIADEENSKICLCIAKDKSGISCNRFARRPGDS